MSNPIQRAVEVATLRRRVADLEAANRTLHQALDEATAALQEATRLATLYGAAEVRVQMPDGQTVTRPLRDCLTLVEAAGQERRN